MKHNILMVDVSPLAYSTWDKVGHLGIDGPEGWISTGLRYGVIRSVRSWANRCSATRVVLVYDSPRATQVRRDEHNMPMYKSNRPWTNAKEEMYSQIPELKQMIELTNYIQMESEGFEADEIICQMARLQSMKGHTVVIASPDHDLYQAIDDRRKVLCFNHRGKGKKAFITEEVARETTGVWPRHLCYFKAIVGDTSDNIAGVVKGKANVQDVAKGLTTFDPKSLNSAISTVDSILGLSDDDRANIRANYGVVYPRQAKEIAIIRALRDEKRLTELFETLEFKSVMKHIPEWTT